MKKKVLCLALALSMLLSLTVPSALASGGMSNFKQQHSYNNRFSDVNTTHWCHPYVKTSYEYGLINGKNSTSTYCPFDNFSVAEALKIAACIHSTYYNGSAENLTNSTSTPYWYSVYVNYCINNGIINNGDFADYNADCTRGQMAYIFSRCLPTSELMPVRNVFIPDCNSTSTQYYSNIQTLYNAGVVSGNALHKYNPTDAIKRSEVAKIICTMVCSSMRDSSYFDGTVVADTDVTSELFGIIENKSFVFSSGAGGWYTVMEIGMDGHFECFHRDSDWGSTGSSYPYGTVYLASCSGKFGNVQKVSEKEYTMQITSIEPGYKSGETWIEDGVLYSTSPDVYGIDDGRNFRVYLKGYEISKLPTECTEYCYDIACYLKSGYSTLPVDVIFNVDEECTFVYVEYVE